MEAVSTTRTESKLCDEPDRGENLTLERTKCQTGVSPLAGALEPIQITRLRGVLSKKHLKYVSC